MPASTFGRAVSRPRWPNHNNLDLPKPIRRRRPQFFLWVDPRASAVRSSALAGRERAPVTRATPSSSSRRQKWQHEAEVVRGRQGSHIIRRRLGAAWSSEGGGRWSLDGRSRASERVDWCAPCSFCTKLRHERATMAHPRWHEAWGWSGWWTMGEQSDGFDGMEGSLWRNVMSVECGNECLRVEHNLFCTNQPSVIKVYVPDQGFPDRGYEVFAGFLPCYMWVKKDILWHI